MSDWINHCGGERPVDPDTRVQVRMRPLIPSIHHAELRKWFVAGDIEGWEHDGSAGDIVGYRIVAEADAP